MDVLSVFIRVNLRLSYSQLPSLTVGLTLFTELLVL